MKRAILLVMLALLAAGLGAVALTSRRASVPATIRTATVTRGTISVTVSATGSIAATSQVDVRSRATGTVTRVFVQAGDHVSQGQLLATIDDPDARASAREAQAQLAQAQTQVAQAGTLVAQDRANVQNAIAKLETALIGNRPEQIAQAQQSVVQAQANVVYDKTSLDRQQQLFQEGFVARSTVDQAQNQYDVALAQLRSAQQNLQLLRAGTLPSDIAAAREQVSAAQAQVQNAEAQVATAKAQVQNAQAVLQNAQERLSEGRIRAPIAGIVATRAIEVGQTVIGGSATSGTSVFTLADITPLLANVSVDETDIAKIRLGMAATVTADALPGVAFAGVVTRIAASGVVSNNVNQYTVTVRLANPSSALKLGMTVDAQFITQQARDTLLLPTEAIRGQGTMKSVLVVGADGRMTSRAVTTGLSDDRNTAITGGLEEGDRVYLGTVPATSPQAAPRNPFMPNFQRQPSGGTGPSRGK